jgi:hypothetical protein
MGVLSSHLLNLELFGLARDIIMRCSVWDLVERDIKRDSHCFSLLSQSMYGVY